MNPLTMPPPAICDACGRSCCTLDQAGAPCFHCGKGLFLHRRWWRFTPCPDCNAGGARCLCDTCNRTGFLATPAEDLDPDQLAQEWDAARARYIAHTGGQSPPAGLFPCRSS